jgi:AraC-like DNA-binding protein
MGYFEDLEFVNGGTPEQCTVHSDRRWPDFCCFMFIPEGPIYYGVDRGERSVLEGPHAFWHHPRHTYQYGPIGESWRHNWVSFRGPRATRLLEEGFMPLSGSGFVRVSQPAVFAEFFRELVRIVHERDPLTHPRGVLILEEMLKILLDDSRRRGSELPYEREMSELSAAIQESPYGRCDFELEARRMGLSYSHFRRLFRRFAGCSPHEYLLRCRMRRAARDLRDTGRQVKDVAAEAGYDDPAQFCKLFRKKIGLSPGRFRQGVPG